MTGNMCKISPKYCLNKHWNSLNNMNSTQIPKYWNSAVFVRDCVNERPQKCKKKEPQQKNLDFTHHITSTSLVITTALSSFASLTLLFWSRIQSSELLNPTETCLLSHCKPTKPGLDFTRGSRRAYGFHPTFFSEQMYPKTYKNTRHRYANGKASCFYSSRFQIASKSNTFHSQRCHKGCFNGY